MNDDLTRVEEILQKPCGCVEHQTVRLLLEALKSEHEVASDCGFGRVSECPACKDCEVCALIAKIEGKTA